MIQDGQNGEGVASDEARATAAEPKVSALRDGIANASIEGNYHRLSENERAKMEAETELVNLEFNSFFPIDMRKSIVVPPFLLSQILNKSADKIEANGCTRARNRRRLSRIMRSASFYIADLEEAILQLDNGWPDRDGLSDKTEIIVDFIKSRRGGDDR